jgi:hypothetical protein
MGERKSPILINHSKGIVNMEAQAVKAWATKITIVALSLATVFFAVAYYLK